MVPSTVSVIVILVLYFAVCSYAAYVETRRDSSMTNEVVSSSIHKSSDEFCEKESISNALACLCYLEAVDHNDFVAPEGFTCDDSPIIELFESKCQQYKDSSGINVEKVLDDYKKMNEECVDEKNPSSVERRVSFEIEDIKNISAPTSRDIAKKSSYRKARFPYVNHDVCCNVIQSCIRGYVVRRRKIYYNGKVYYVTEKIYYRECVIVTVCYICIPPSDPPVIARKVEEDHIGTKKQSKKYYSS